MKLPLIATFAFLSSLTASSAQGIGSEYPWMISDAQANQSLPAHVNAAAEEGKVTLFADYERANYAGIPLYLVNRSHMPLKVPTEDGDAFVKMERQLPDSSWERVQSHQYSFCGNSYADPVLPPGMHLHWKGFAPKSGQPAHIRYRSYSTLNVTSNIGDGFFDENEAHAAARDGMSLSGVPEIIVEAFAPAYGRPDQRPNSERLAILGMAALLGERPAIREGAAKWVAGLGRKTQRNADENLILRTSEAILSRNWGPSAGHQPLLQACLDALEQTDKKQGLLVWPRQLVWQAVAQIARMEFSSQEDSREAGEPVDLALWKKFSMVALEDFKKAKPGETMPSSRVFWNTSLVDETLDNRQIEALLPGGLFQECEAAVDAMIRRSLHARLAELSPSLPVEKQIMIFRKLAPEINRKRLLDHEPLQSYWNNVLSSEPYRAVSALSLPTSSRFEEPSPFHRSDFAPLLSALEKEVSRCAPDSPEFKFTGDGVYLSDAVAFVASWRNREDIPLFQSLLSYPGYFTKERNPDGDSSPKARESRIYSVRSEAISALRAAGQPVPEEIVTERSIGGK